jgi:hypothetical protein
LQRWWLSLNGLTSLSDAAAESLSKCGSSTLHLHGLTTLSDSAAVNLSKSIGSGLYLPRVLRERLSDAAKKSLSGYNVVWYW